VTRYTLWYNEYRGRNGFRYFSLPCEDRREAVRVGAHEQGLHGSLVVFRWRVVVLLPGLISENNHAGQKTRS
jgi:hypothetical protein